MITRQLLLASTVACLLLSCGGRLNATEPLVPKIDGDWWQIAGNPDLGDWANIYIASLRPTLDGIQFARLTWHR